MTGKSEKVAAPRNSGGPGFVSPLVLFLLIHHNIEILGRALILDRPCMGDH